MNQITNSNNNWYTALKENEKYIRINIGQPREVEFWTKELNTYPFLLHKAVKEVGPMISDVKKWLSEFS
jgi:hypothetical protein